ncbi:MAG: D-arabinono-1,4-lactone oxidase [Pseudomonadota bacterium]
MPKWSNWSGRLTANPTAIHFPRSEADIQRQVAQALSEGLQVRVAGATHSHAPLVQNDGLLLDPQGLSGIISTDPETQTAWVWAGTRIYAMGLPLNRAGLALRNQGDIDQQAIAGATATGTHGTGATLQNLSASVIGATLVLADGTLITCGPANDERLWQASRLHLGAFGVITQLHLQLRTAYCLQERSWTAPLEEVMADSGNLISGHRHFEFFWYPQTDTANVKVINECTAPSYPLASEGERQAWSHEVLPNHRPHRHTEMEYSIPAAAGPACMRDIQHLLNTHFTDVRWPVEYRTLAADDVWLSSAYQRDTVTISVHQDIAADDEPYFRACEEIFLAHQGRPHWGKVNYLAGDTLAAMHPKWDEWWQMRNSVDPQGLFLNQYLQGIR